MLSLLQTSLPRPVGFLWLIGNLPSPSSPRTGSGADSPILYCLEDNVPILPSSCSYCRSPSWRECVLLACYLVGCLPLTSLTKVLIYYVQPKEICKAKIMLCFGVRLGELSAVAPHRGRELHWLPHIWASGFPISFPDYRTFICGAQKKVYENTFGKL